MSKQDLSDRDPDFFMKELFINSRTLEGGKSYDVLFQVKGNQIEKVERLFDFYTIHFEDVKMSPVLLPVELTLRILFKTLVALLREYHFADAMQLISINREMVDQVYYCLFGKNKVQTMVKLRRLSKILILLQNLYDFYFAAESVYESPTIVLEYEREFSLSNTSAFYPWEMENFISVINVAHAGVTDRDPYTMFCMGEFYGDFAFMENVYERKGLLKTDRLGFPFMHIILMDAFSFLNVFDQEETRYHFSRFTTFVKAIFGSRCRVFYYESKVPLLYVDEGDEDFTHIFDNAYRFKELPYYKRK